MEIQKIEEAIKTARDIKKRNFKQSIDLIVNLKGLDLKKPENKIKAEIVLNHLSKKHVIGIMADTLLPKAEKLEDVLIIRKEEIESLGKDKKRAKNIVAQCHGFIAEAPLMPLVGRFLGSILSPRNMMPSPVPVTVADLKPVVERSRKTVRVHLKDSPTLQFLIGSEEMENSKVAENAKNAIDVIIATLPKGEENVKNIMVKLTMGKPIKIATK